MCYAVKQWVEPGLLLIITKGVHHGENDELVPLQA
jgi:hypothetical protein